MRSELAKSESGPTSSRGLYQAQLLSELKRRQLANPKYSLRSFARDLVMSPAHLSKVLRGEKSLSVEKALSVAENLGYSENEAAQFCQGVQHSNLGSLKLQKVLRRREETEIEDGSFVPLSLDAFQAVSDWYHVAIRELTECKKFDPVHLAERLGITEQEAELAVKRLVRLGILEKRGTSYRKAERSISITTDRPSHALRNFHQQMIEKAKRSIVEQASADRDITGVTLAISPDKIDLAKEEIRKFRRRMNRLMESSRPTEVYQLNVQFFALTRKTPAGKTK